MTVAELAVIMALLVLAGFTVLVLAAAGLKPPRYRRSVPRQPRATTAIL